MVTPEILGVIALTARAYKGVVHGDDPDGIIDVEFPNTMSAVSWARISVTTCALRRPITSFTDPVVIQFREDEFIDPRIIPTDD